MIADEAISYQLKETLMPLIWRYLLKHFFKIFALSFFGFIGLGLLIKHKNLASFIAEGASIKQTLLLAFFFLINSSPLVLSISTLIASFITTSRLSSSHEILSFRASGLSLTEILSPLYVAATCITLINFVLIAEYIPYTKLQIEETYFTSTTMNPLVLLRQKAIPFLKDPYIEMNLRKNGSKASDVLIIYPDEKQGLLTLFLADEISVKKSSKLKASNLSLLSHIPSKEGFDHTVLDTQKEADSSLSNFVSLMRKRPDLRKPDMHSLSFLAKSPLSKYKVEFLQRISKSLLPFTFALLGASLGLFIRQSNERVYLRVFFYAFLTFFCIFFAKKIHLPLVGSALLLFLPHLIIGSIALVRQRMLLKGDVS